MKHKELVEQYMELQELYFSPKKNSKNSSKPPSSDGDFWNPRKNQSLRKKSDKSSGGQLWHKWSTKSHWIPDTILECRKDHCPECNANIESKIRNTIEKRQEFDIPPIEPTIIQYERQETVCDCWCKVSGEFPKHITGHTQRWPNMASLISYLNVRHKLPYQRLTEIVREVLWIEISEWSVNNILMRMWEKASDKCHEIMEWVKSSAYVWTDETGNHVNGKKRRVWTRHSNKFVYLCIDKSRGYNVVKSHFGESFAWVLWHDCWAAHNNTMAKAHQLCLAHFHRDINFVIEKDRSKWSYSLLGLLLKAQKAKKHWLNWSLKDRVREQIKNYYYRKLDELCHWENSPHKDTMRLLKRLRKHRDKIFTFLEYKEVPAHNNTSEQIIRNQKIHKKISWGFRSVAGGERHCSILSVIETSRRHGLEVLESLQKLYLGELSRN